MQVFWRGLRVLARQARLGEKPPAHAVCASQLINHAVRDNLANLCTVCRTACPGMQNWVKKKTQQSPMLLEKGFEILA